MRIDIAARTDVGQHKRNNEDYFGVFREDTPGLKLFDEGALLCVADGLGGHTGGEIASKLAVSIMKDCLKVEPADLAEDEAEDEKKTPVLKVLAEGIAHANESIHKTNTDLVKHKRPMGTTLLAAIVEKKKVHIANVGDSRCYHIRDGEILTKTEDHSWVDEQVRLGLMSRSEAESDYRRNIVTRCIGTHPEVEIDRYVWHVVAGDILLVCTDGLVNMVKDAEIREVFRKRATSAEIASRLVDLANDKGGRDNITVIVAHISPTIGHFVGGFFRKQWKRMLWTLLALAFGAACFAAGYYARGIGL
jgi:PPM family protein phosphatase